MMSRLKALLTGKITWLDADGTPEYEVLGWRDRWSLFGIHSWNWRWVHRLGQMDCGCTRNPLTRRTVLNSRDRREQSIHGSFT